jgi:hypothetical protein
MSHSAFARVAALLAALAVAASGRSQEPEPVPLPLPGGKPAPKVSSSDAPVVVLDKGPIHEGFVQPGAQVRGKGITAPKAPPLPVDENPPLATLESAGMQWISGYWAWDGQRKDFIWVCGCYRIPPPDRSWEPGRWKVANKVWTYFPGYWRPTNGKGVLVNLPEPPASEEEAPTSPNENPKAMWVPGIWEYKNGKFVWQPGYWPPAHEALLWQPGQYVAAETGFTFVPGHWDYPLEDRGVLFAPVFFSQAQREKSSWAYRPQSPRPFGSDAKWGKGGLFDSLCIGPNFNSYYFGDYAQWRNAALPGNTLPVAASLPGVGAAKSDRASSGYRPWDSVSRGYTNPLWQHYVRLNRSDSGLAKGVITETVRTGSKNPLAFVQGGVGGCASASSCPPGPHVHWVPTPVYHGGRYRR